MDNKILKQVKDEVEAICKKHNVILVPVVVHQGDRTFSSIEIVSVPEQAEAGTPTAAAVDVSKAE
jgi:hypothetical protein